MSNFSNSRSNILALKQESYRGFCEAFLPPMPCPARSHYIGELQAPWSQICAYPLERTLPNIQFSALKLCIKLALRSLVQSFNAAIDTLH
jgi:hypothetical protein